MNTAIKKALSGSDLRYVMSNGTDFLGGEITWNLLGGHAIDSKIYFSLEEIKKLRQKHSLFTPAQVSVKNIYEKFQNQTLDGKSFLADISRYKNESFYVSETPAPGTYIISRELIEGSLGKNILDCQHLLIAHAKQHLPLTFCSETFNKNLVFAEQELNDQNSEIKMLMQKDGSEAAEKIANLSVCKMFVSDFSTITQFILVDNCINNRRLLLTAYSYSKSITADRQNFASFGRFDGPGARVDKGLFGDMWNGPGALFSCSVETLFI